MKPTNILYASIILAMAAGMPANAQTPKASMNHSSMAPMKMSSADMKMAMSCKRMSKTAMMKNKRCQNLMNTHSAMMKMSTADMQKMQSCMKMPQKAMMNDKRCSDMMKTHHNGMMGHM